jgi:Trk K+ transport system NAD-binding subunit
MSDSYGDAFVFTGSITNIHTLIEAGVGPQSTLLICSHDEENLVCALLARELKCERILIVNNREHYASLINQLGFDGIFSPRQLAVNEIRHQTLKLLAKSAYSVSTGDDVEVRSFVVSADSELCGLQLSELQTSGFPREHAVIAALIEQDSTTHVMPTGSDRLLQNSTAYVVARSSDFHRIKGLFGKRKSRFRLW